MSEFFPSISAAITRFKAALALITGAGTIGATFPNTGSGSTLQDAVTLLGHPELHVRPTKCFQRLFESRTTATTQIKAVIFGDSVGKMKPIRYFNLLEKSMNAVLSRDTPLGDFQPCCTWGGGDCTPVINAGTFPQTANAWSYWITGNYWTTSAGTDTSWTFNGVNPTFDNMEVRYIAEAGAGTFKLQVNGVDQQTFNADNGGAPAIVRYTFTQASAQLLTKLIGLTGNVKIISVHFINTVNGGVNTYDCSMPGTFLSDKMITGGAQGQGIFQAFLADLVPDLISSEMKHWDANFTTAFTDLANILDAACPLADKIFIGSTPVAVSDNLGLLQAAVIRGVCISRGYIWWDGYAPVQSYANLVAMGWQGDGTHPAYQCQAYLASLLWSDLGFDRFMYGVLPRAVNDPQRASTMGSGTRISSNPVVGYHACTTDGFNLDFKWNVPRSVWWNDNAAVLKFRISANEAVFPHVGFQNYYIGGAAPTWQVFHEAPGAQEVRAYRNIATPAGPGLPVRHGMMMAGPYTRAQLLALPANSLKGYLAYCSDATGGACIAWSHGASPTDWLNLVTGAAI